MCVDEQGKGLPEELISLYACWRIFKLVQAGVTVRLMPVNIRRYLNVQRTKSFSGIQ